MLSAILLAMAPPTPAMRTVLNELASFNPPPIENTLPRVAREAPTPKDAVQQALARRGRPGVEIVGDISHRIISGPGGQLLLRVYRPRGVAARQQTPGLVYFHGGGFVIANLNVYDPSCRALANAAKMTIVSVAYRLAPENPYPAAFDDAEAATRYVMTNAASFGIRPGRVAIGGESAGGNLATVTCMRLKQEGARLPYHQLLVYPVTDWTRSTDRSIEENRNAKPLNKAMLGWFKKFTFRNPSDANSAFASPYRATTAQLRGLPPATFVFAQIDPLRQQGQEYAAKLRNAGVRTDARLYRGVTHEFFGMAALVPEAKQAVAYAARRLNGR